MRTDLFDFELPKELIAAEPAARREESRLLVLHRGEPPRLEHRRFADVEEYLRPGDLLVVNDSRVLRARLLQAAQDEADASAADARRSQVRTVDRSERVRTYNFPENRISDHRVGFKAYNLDQVLDGALDDIIDALTRADVEALLAGNDQS